MAEDVPKLQRRAVEFSENMWRTLDAAADGAPLRAWMENYLRRQTLIKRTAKSIGVELPKRARDMRGGRRVKSEPAE